jgi:hypothetical protein
MMPEFIDIDYISHQPRRFAPAFAPAVRKCRGETPFDKQLCLAGWRAATPKAARSKRLLEAAVDQCANRTEL